MEKINQKPFEVIDLKKSYGKVEALTGVSLAMKEGEVLGLLGPNGAGKTTLISILTTVEKPTSGQAFIFGRNVLENSQELKALIGIVPQELLNHGFFSILEVLEFHSGYYGLNKNRDHILFLLDRLGLLPHKDKKVRELSGGMKRRFLIAKALVHRPKLLLLDEPTAGVDIELRSTLWSFVEELNQSGMSILLTTHYLEEAENLCDRVAIIHNGELKKIGPTRDLIQDLTQRNLDITFSQDPSVENHPYFMGQKDHVFTFKIPSKMQLGQLVSELKIDMSFVTDIKIREGRLEDAFLSLLESDGK